MQMWYSACNPFYTAKIKIKGVKMSTGSKIKSHVIWAIFSVLMFLPTGIPALWNALRVNDSAKIGDIELAKERSLKAKTWCLATTIFWGVLVLSGIITTIILLNVYGSARSYGSYYYY